jgi:transposase
MSVGNTSKEALIIRMANAGMSYSIICAKFGIGSHRVSNTLKRYRRTGIIPEPLSRRPRLKLSKAIFEFIDIRTLQQANLSNAQLIDNIKTRFHLQFHPSTIAMQRHLLGIRY